MGMGVYDGHLSGHKMFFIAGYGYGAAGLFSIMAFSYCSTNVTVMIMTRCVLP